MPEQVSAVRHWKQRFREEGPFRWRRPTVYGGREFAIGDPVPEGLLSRVKVRRFWRSGRIEMADFVAPDVVTGLPVLAGPRLEPVGGGWWLLVGAGEPLRVRGRAAAEAALEAALAAAEEAAA